MPIIISLSQARVSAEPYEAHAFSHSFSDNGLVGYCAGMCGQYDNDYLRMN